MKRDGKKRRGFPIIRSSKLGQTRAQVKLSFGMIFSIILIIVFIALVFFVIMKFLDLGETINVGKFADDFQSDVDKLWKGDQGSQENEYSLPKKIGQICFVDLLESEKGAYKNEDFYEAFERYSSDKNLFFYPIGSTELNGLKIEHIDFGENNPNCFEVKNGKVKIGIEKDFDDELVSVDSF